MHSQIHSPTAHQRGSYYDANGAPPAYPRDERPRSLAHSQHLPHFRNVISTIALYEYALRIVEISDILGIEAFEVVRVLLNLQAIIHVPGTDEEGEVTLCHTSLRDFLTTESRSGPFFVPPSFHLYLSYYCFSSPIEDSIPGVVGDRKDFGRHWRSFVESDDCDFCTELEHFKARQPLLVDRVSYHSFLCSMFFYTLNQSIFQLLNKDLCMLTECANQLVLAADCADTHTRRWLEEVLHYSSRRTHERSTAQFTEHTYKALQHDLQRASNAIQAHFSGVFESWASSIVELREIVSDGDILASGTDIFKTLQRVVDSAHLEWEELKVTPRPPLSLTIGEDLNWGGHMCFSFDEVKYPGDDGSDSESKSSNSESL